VSVFVPIPGCFCYYGSVDSLKSGIMIIPALLFLLRIALAIWSLLFPYEFCDFSIFVKNVITILMGIALSLYIDFGSLAILTIFILQIYEHGELFTF
jgi:hypothetical protein